MKTKAQPGAKWYQVLVIGWLIPCQLFMGFPTPIYAASSVKKAREKLVSSSFSGLIPRREVRDTLPFKPTFNLNADPSDVEIEMARIFYSPLMPLSGPASAGENAALALALHAFHKRPSTEDTSALTSFIASFPDSRWNASIEYNLGVIHLETGYLTQALSDWSSSWNLAKKETSAQAHALADASFGRLTNLSAQLGRVDDLKTLFAEAGKRGFYGAAAQQVRGAESGYRTMQRHPAIAFKCGPFALDSIRTANLNVHPRSATVQSAASTPRGTSLAMVMDWSEKMNLGYQMAKRTAGSSIIVPSIVHWKLGHFAAIVRQAHARYLIQDPTFAGQELWVSKKALEQETSGFFLVPKGLLPTGWTSVSRPEANGVWGRGGAQGQDMGANTGGDKKNGCGGGPTPMTQPDVFTMLAALYLEDTPVRYTVPVGPKLDLKVSYAPEMNAPPSFSWSNFGYNWSFQYVSFITVDASSNLTINLPGGGTETANYSTLDNASNVYPPDIKSHAQMFIVNPGVYDRRLPDGSHWLYSQPDGAGRIFLKQVFDPQGNSLVLNYDSTFRLTSIQDQLGQSTVLTYISNIAGNAGYYKISTITDPFSRQASFLYDTNTVQLTSITDVLGIKSQFTYDTNYFVDSLTTPYGRTTFYRYVPTSDSEGESGIRITWPDGTSSITENYIGHELNTYYWDRKASPFYPDKSSATVTNWLLSANSRTEAGIINYTRNPLEGGQISWPYFLFQVAPPGSVQYSYPSGYSVPPQGGSNPPPEDNFTHFYTGSSNRPTVASRVLDDGNTQQYLYSYNPIGNVTSAVSPLPYNRAFTYYYQDNNIDLLQVRQTTGSNNDVVAAFTYNSQHEPLTYEDGSGRIKTYTYNALGQVTSVTDPSPGGITLYNYTSNYLTSVQGPLSGSSDVTTYGYTNGVVSSVTDSEGYKILIGHDAYDRVTTVTYPDNTYQQVYWSLLDPVFLRDRLGNWTQQQFNSLRQLVAVIDPLGQKTQYKWCTCGSLASLTDPAGNVTTWGRDLQGRPTAKTYPDQSTLTYGYETNTSRLKSLTDALGQVKNYAYNDDDTLASISYAGAVNPTSTVTYSYDPNYLRLTSVANGWGSVGYTYNSYLTDPLGAATTGAGKVSQITNSALGSTGNVSFSYDGMGRITNRSINGSANSTTWTLDPMSRVTAIANPLGSFGYTYVDSTPGSDKGTRRLSSMSYPNGQGTNYAYTSDERLQEIKNLNPSSAVLSQFDYTYNSNGDILSWKRQADSNAATRYDFGYDADRQLGSAVLKTDSTNAILHQYYYGYDVDGNRKTEQVDSSVTTAGTNNLNQLTGLSSGGATRFQGTISQPGTVQVNGQAATMPTATNFLANPTLPTGTNIVSVVATNGNNVSQTNRFQVVIPPGTAVGPSYDADGNMTNNGSGQAYRYDAENRLVGIVYSSGANSGNHTEMTYDGLGRRASIVERTGTSMGSGTITSTKQLLWVGDEIAEERNASSNVTKRFSPQGEQIAGVNYYFTQDHLGSTREMTNGSGAIQARYDYDSYGRTTLISGSNISDFQYASYYQHQISNLALTKFRAYDANTAKWLSRDPLKNAEMSQGPNLYDYVLNDPIYWTDPLGLDRKGGANTHGATGSGCPDNTPYLKILLGFETFPISIGIAASLTPYEAAVAVVGGAYVYYNTFEGDDPNSQPDGPPEEVP